MRAALALLAAAALVGCGVLGNEGPPSTYYVLHDLGEVRTATARTPQTLLVLPTTASAFYDTQNIVYSRTPATRAYYQFASWTERPGKRFNELMLQRLESRGGFATVANSTAGVRGSLLLATTLNELYHLDTEPPGRSRIEVTAELTDRNTRALLARRTFRAEVEVREDNAAGAVAAFNRAVTALLDELVPWVEQAAARAPAGPAG